MVVKKSNKKLRICIDPKDLNKAIRRPHYNMPTIDDMAPDLTKAKVFSVVDAKDGFWQVKLTDKSSYCTTFNTPFGSFAGFACRLGFVLQVKSFSEESALR